MAILRVNIRAHIDLRACNVNHLAEYLCETSQRIENEGGCRHTYALPLEFQNWIIHQKPKRRKIGGGIAAPRGSSWGHIYIYILCILCMHALRLCVCSNSAKALARRPRARSRILARRLYSSRGWRCFPYPGGMFGSFSFGTVLYQFCVFLSGA